MSLPADYTTTRTELQRVATHVVARARWSHGGRFGLVATPSGLATPHFGDDDTVVRLAGTTLIVERRTSDGVLAATLALPGASLAAAATFVGTDLDGPFSPGADAPAVGDPDAPLALGSESAAVALGWYATGARVLDAVLPRLSRPTAAQLWPEHFDLGLSGTTAAGGVNLGASPGDAGVTEPYLYVGPWTADRPADPAYWNAGFGAVATRSELLGTGDPVAAGVAFVERGLDLLGRA